ncbi:alpha/beta hydrolase [Helicobacter bilis]|uniref:alpha/beta hydrolase n=1 Tax=Helicobacter bilis TaxID=37372 RepID=UPI00051DB3AF|nr:alpha/beta hydrolase [Helicobacter bilis]MCI7411407.1 alpha/beta hydrolase [Helicobacter bilis]MDD7296398.1 alpha/beta hydrolase [Helicobacter bilis]MDY4400428.1 alpha/beta hydrolase [Helicobacter bilis]TLE07259.1 alpha/beta hydrolase [Helicobacter bilis]
MRYFSGFGLYGDYALFELLLHDFGYVPNHYDIIGFSSGALSALQYAMQRIANKQRVGRVILLSPLLYTHYISNNSVLNIAGLDSDLITSFKRNVENLDSKNNTQIITHVSFEPFAKEFSHINIYTLWNLFKKACIHSYKKDKLKYHTTLCKQLGFHITDDIMCLDSHNNKECRVFTQFEKLTTLRNLWDIHAIDLEKIEKKSQKFVVFIAENDRITNSKLISKYLSQFGICYILKGRNHILQKVANKRA